MDCIDDFAIAAPHLTGFRLKLFVKLLEAPLVGSLIISNLKKENKMVEVGYFIKYTNSKKKERKKEREYQSISLAAIDTHECLA